MKRKLLCLAFALWNGKDPILKERLFGLTNSQGNHGEDVKELYYYLDATPTCSYARMLYKYPQAAFPYQQLIDENHRRGLNDPEFELIDTGIFADDRYFDVFVEYAKADADDVLMRITVHNRGAEAASLAAACRRSGFAIPGVGDAIPQSRRCRRKSDPLTGSVIPHLGDIPVRFRSATGISLLPKTKPTCTASSNAATPRAISKTHFTIT